MKDKRASMEGCASGGQKLNFPHISESFKSAGKIYGDQMAAIENDQVEDDPPDMVYQ